MKTTPLLLWLSLLARPSNAWSTGTSSAHRSFRILKSAHVYSTISTSKRTSCSGLWAAAKGNGDEPVDLEWLKTELTEYLKIRDQANADEEAKKEVGKKIGGTKGNAILEFVSVSPSKESIVKAPANPFDYDELTKYGYGNLVTPMMKAGGRFAMYELLGLEAPKITSRPKPKTAPKLVIDRTGENDRARYSGLKLGQVLDDDMQAKALEEVQEKVKRGESLKPKLQEEMYVRPFADKRNVGPKQTPNWTPERLDEWGKEQGKAMAWARKAREGEFVGDPMETLDLEISQKAYSILTGLLVATVFGKSTPTLLVRMDLENLLAVRETLQAPALVLLLAAVGSAILAAVQASSLNRNQAVWFIKGLLGGPLTIQQLQSLSGLSTQGEIDAQERAKRHQ